MAYAEAKPTEHQEDTLSLRGAIGLVLRDLRSRDHKTLREVSEKAGVSLGYLSEVERGQKEASSELLSSIAEALGVSTAQLLRMVQIVSIWLHKRHFVHGCGPYTCDMGPFGRAPLS